MKVNNLEYSKYILSIIEAINKTELSEYTKKTIKSNLNKLYNSTKTTFIKDVINQFSNIENINSKHTFLGAIKSVIKNVELNINEKDMKKINDLFLIIKLKKEKNELATQANTKQQNRYISYKELTDLTDNLEDEEDKLYYALYTYQPPLRADYNAIYIIDNMLTKAPLKMEELDKNKNYYSVKTNQFIINEYKTAKTNGTIIFKPPTKLKNMIIKSLEDTPRAVLLYNHIRGVNYPITPNYLSKRIAHISTLILKDNIKIAEENKAISINDLRHLFIEENNFETTNDIEELFKNAYIMGHSLFVSQKIYKKDYKKSA